MKGTRNTRIPKFKSLEEEREYWEARGPLAEGHEGRVNKPQTRQKRSSFLAVRLTGEELTKLRDIAAKHGLGPSTYARLLLTRSIEHQSSLPGDMTLDEFPLSLNRLLVSLKEDVEKIKEIVEHETGKELISR